MNAARTGPRSHPDAAGARPSQPAARLLPPARALGALGLRRSAAGPRVPPLERHPPPRPQAGAPLALERASPCRRPLPPSPCRRPSSPQARVPRRTDPWIPPPLCAGEHGVRDAAAAGLALVAGDAAASAGQAGRLRRRHDQRRLGDRGRGLRARRRRRVAAAAAAEPRPVGQGLLQGELRRRDAAPSPRRLRARDR